MKTLIFVLALSLCPLAFAASNSQGPHGGIAAARGLAAGRAAANAASHGANAGQSGNGGSYWSPQPDSSLVDAYQPWPQSEMRKFQKP